MTLYNIIIIFVCVCTDGRRADGEPTTRRCTPAPSVRTPARQHSRTTAACRHFKRRRHHCFRLNAIWWRQPWQNGRAHTHTTRRRCRHRRYTSMAPDCHEIYCLFPSSPPSQYRSCRWGARLSRDTRPTFNLLDRLILIILDFRLVLFLLYYYNFYLLYW